MIPRRAADPDGFGSLHDTGDISRKVEKHMTGTENVFDIRTGEAWRHFRQPHAGRSVAKLAATLARDLKSADASAGAFPPIQMRLDELCGVADATMARLSALAVEGLLTSATAALLGLRHARELRRPPAPEVLPGDGTVRHFGVELWGTFPDDFALRIAPSETGLIVVAAPFDDLDRMYTLVDGAGPGVCLLVGYDEEGRLSTGVLASRCLQRSLARACRSSACRFVCHVLVLSGSGLQTTSARSSLVGGLEEAIRSHGRARLVRLPAAPRHRSGSPPACPILAGARLLLELAFPGLVHPSPR